MQFEIDKLVFWAVTMATRKLSILWKSGGWIVNVSFPHYKNRYQITPLLIHGEKYLTPWLMQ